MSRRADSFSWARWADLDNEWQNVGALWNKPVVFIGKWVSLPVTIAR
jgi:hypothetical protein